MANLNRRSSDSLKIIKTYWRFFWISKDLKTKTSWLNKIKFVQSRRVSEWKWGDKKQINKFELTALLLVTVKLGKIAANPH